MQTCDYNINCFYFIIAALSFFSERSRRCEIDFSSFHSLFTWRAMTYVCISILDINSKKESNTFHLISKWHIYLWMHLTTDDDDDSHSLQYRYVFFAICMYCHKSFATRDFQVLSLFGCIIQQARIAEPIAVAWRSKYLTIVHVAKRLFCCKFL